MTLFWTGILVVLVVGGLLVAFSTRPAPMSLVGAVVRAGSGTYRVTSDTSDPNLERWQVRTPAGPATITRVWDDRGEAYEVETRFRRDEIHRYYEPPALARALDRVTREAEQTLHVRRKARHR